MSSTPNWRVNVSSICSPSFFRIRPVSTKTQVSWLPTALVTSAAATAESTPPESAQSTFSVADLGADRRDLVFDDRGVRPRRGDARDVVQEVRQQLLAALGVRDLGVELHGVQAPRDVLHHRDRRLG